MNPYYQDSAIEIYHGDCLSVLKELPDESINCCITSPPYWSLRDYGVNGQIGLEKTPQEYVAKMVEIFREVWRCLKDDGTLWLNLGDSYAGSGNGSCDYRPESASISKNDDKYKGQKPAPTEIKPKNLIGIPWRVAFALQADGWYLRQDIIWHKPNPMPESVTDRCTKSHEYIFLMAKSQKYYYDADEISEDSVGNEYEKTKRPAGRMAGARYISEGIGQKEVGDSLGQTGDKRNKRSVWTITTKSYPEAHFATFPPDLIKPMVLAGCPKGGTVLDPFIGSGTTAMVSKELNRKCIGIELNEKYIELIMKRTQQEVLAL